jgi:hypothetical protein
MTPQQAQDHCVEVVTFNWRIKCFADNHILTVNASEMNYGFSVNGSAEDEPGLALVSKAALSSDPHAGLN